MTRRPRLTALAFFLLAVPILGVAALAAGTLLITSAARDPFDSHTYFRLCPVVTNGACTEFSGWQVLAIALVSLTIGARLVVTGIRRYRSTARGVE